MTLMDGNGGNQLAEKQDSDAQTHIEDYDPGEVEPRWQQRWEEDGLHRAVIDPDRPKSYFLTMLPYTSGDLHIGHWFIKSTSDARARYMKMRGYNVMLPIGFDAFGLPAENAAIERNIHPKEWTYQNIDNMRRQLRSMGAMWDWSREAVSSDPEYYRWSQWFFLQFFKNDLAYKKMSPVDWCPNDNTTLAREQVVGDERVCERCGTQVIKKDLNQWFFRITNYADELLDFSTIDWPDRVQLLQTNWIGRSEGARVTFTTETDDPIEVFTTRPDTLWGATFMVLAPEHPLVDVVTPPDFKDDVEKYVEESTRMTDIQREALDKEKTGVFTGGYARNPVNGERIPIWIASYVLMTYGTGAIMAVPAHDQRDFEFALKFGLPILPVIDRPDQQAKSFVLAGTTEDGLVDALKSKGIAFEDVDGALQISLGPEDVDGYIELVKAFLKVDSWVEIVGTHWLFIFRDEVIPWDSLEREVEVLVRCKDLEPSVSGARTVMEMLWDQEFYQDVLYHNDYGMMIHSGTLSGTPAVEAVSKTTDFLVEKNTGQFAVNYRIRDWLISRQRYWGAPIPIIDCAECGLVPVPEDELPVLLPDDVEWLPTGQSPLKLHPAWKTVTCPECGGAAERETDTMDTFMCSSWYHLRYLSPDYDQGPFDPEQYNYWMPVDTYTGGVEHAVMHLIYTRFFHKALRDLGIVEGQEPMLQLRNQGQILGPDGQRMSKSRGNVVDPDEQVQAYGADTVRAYLMFGYRWTEGGPWNAENIQGVVRWLHRVWKLVLGSKDLAPEGAPDGAPDGDPVEVKKALERKMHQTIRQVSNDLEKFEFNTVISALMEFTNQLVDAFNQDVGGSRIFNEAIDNLLLLMAAPTPHIAEELWNKLDKPYSIHQQEWPTFDPDKAQEEEITLVVQVNGRVRDRIIVPASISDDDAKEKALASDGAQKFLLGGEPRKVIVVPGRLVNIVV
jgi:leucyl-tRNA synthetase